MNAHPKYVVVEILYLEAFVCRDFNTWVVKAEVPYHFLKRENEENYLQI